MAEQTASAMACRCSAASTCRSRTPPPRVSVYGVAAPPRRCSTSPLTPCLCACGRARAGGRAGGRAGVRACVRACVCQEAIVEAQRREEEERARADEAEAALAALRDEMRDAQARSLVARPPCIPTAPLPKLSISSRDGL
eukprot:3382305-Pleurochrysis_carterae.AAC.1